MRRAPIVLCFIAAYAALPACCSLPKIVFMGDPLSAEEHNDLGVAYERQKKTDLAEKEYRAALKKRPEWHLPHFNLGNLFYIRGDRSRAEAEFREAIKLNEFCADCLNNLAWLCLEAGRHAEARGYIERAMRIQNRREYEDTLREIREAESRSR